MADMILACVRDGRPGVAADDVRRAALRLAPPELPPREPLLLESAGVVVAVANPTAEGVRLHAAAVRLEGDGRRDHDAGPPDGASSACCLGVLIGRDDAWWRVSADPPEGTYCLARWDVGTIELVSDICASRTLWYALTDDLFVASTSQRAVVTLLRSFELLPAATAGYMAVGSPGPGVSWDARLDWVPSDARATLDRAAWRVTERRTPYVLEQAPGDDETHVGRVSDAITATCQGLDIDAGRWALTMSGGLDSRVLLAYLLESGVRPRCVTWTARGSLRNPVSDVSIAKQVARRNGVDLEVLVIDDAEIDVETVLTRFVAADECRNDELAGYLDGLALWRDLTLSGVQGVIRGDQSMGGRWRPRTYDSARFANAGARPVDYPEGHLLRRLGLAEQRWPEYLRNEPGETLADYGVRLEQQCCLPVFLGGLSALKARYVEIANPFLSRRCIGVVRSLPYGLRDRAQAYSRIAHRLQPTIPYARVDSTAPVSDLLERPEFVELAVRELGDPEMERVVPGDGRMQILIGMATTEPPAGAKAHVRAAVKSARLLLPYRVADRLYPGWKGPEALGAVDLALRAVLAKRMIALFEEDAAALASAT